MKDAVCEIQEKQDNLTAAIKIKDVTIEEQNKEIKRLKSIVDKNGETRGMMQNDLERIRGERGDLEDELDGKRDDIEDLGERIKELEEEGDRLRIDMEGRGDGEGEASRILREEVEAENRDLKEILRSKDEAIARIEEELANARAMYEEQDEDMREQWKRDMDGLRSRVEKDKRGWKKEIKDAREREGGWREKLEKGVGEVKRIKKKLEKEKMEKEKLEKEKVKMIEENGRVKAEMEEKERRSRGALEQMMKIYSN